MSSHEKARFLCISTRMSAKFVLLWSIFVFLGLSALLIVPPGEAPVASLQYGLGPAVETDPL